MSGRLVQSIAPEALEALAREWAREPEYSSRLAAIRELRALAAWLRRIRTEVAQ